MDEINKRFKELRINRKKSQEEWGKTLGLSKSGVSDIERGRRNVTEQHIRLLCVEPIDGKYVNEDYLRTGDGDMFKTLPEEDETAALVSELLEDSDNPLYDIIKEIMRTYCELDSKSQEVIRKFSSDLRKNLSNEKEG